MKYLVALFLVSLALQPLDLQACTMDEDQQPSHHAAMHEDGDSPCCNPDNDEPTGDCGGASHCAFLSLGFLVIPAAPGAQLPAPDHHYELFDAGHYSGPPPRPLFRPPIA